jgi:predicted phage terminase large subunit-like protein
MEAIMNNIWQSIRSDFAAFVQRAFRELKGERLVMAPYIEYLCDTIADRSRRHIINLPPRHLKTMIGSICLSAWTLGRNPRAKVMVLAGSEELAEEISRQVRHLMRTEWFMKAFPTTRLSKSKSRAMDFATTAGGGLFAASIHSNVTGFGGNLVIVDDPVGIGDAANLDKLNKINEKFQNEVLSRLDNHRTGWVLIIMQRLHEEDLCGYVLQQGGWTRTVLPLIAPRTKTFELGFGKWKREKGEVLRPDAFSKQEIKRLQKGSNFQLLWQQNPLGNSFKAVKRRHFGTFEQPPDVGVVLSVDTSLIAGEDSSFNVVQAWCGDGKNYFLIDQWRDQCGYERLRKRTLKMASRHRPAAILVERTGNGAALIDELRHRHRTIAIVPDGTKLDRFRRVCRLIYSGKVLLKKEAPWLEELLDELTHFPLAPTDDQMDTLTQSLAWLSENPALAKPPARAICANGGPPVRTDGRGLLRGPGMVCGLNSNHAPNGPFIQAKAWVEFGEAPYRR